MNKNQNPWGMILDTMRTQGSKDNPMQATIGRIVSLNPIEIKAFGTTLNSNQLMIDDRLTYDDLTVDDNVMIIPSDTRFIILCKVINAVNGLKNNDSDQYIIDQINKLNEDLKKIRENTTQ